jgi:predicted deacetylase
LLVIPHHHGRQRICEPGPWRDWIDERLALGDEIALHGLLHRDDGPTPHTIRSWFTRRVLTQDEAEFSTLDIPTARGRIYRGLDLFDKCGWRPTGFVAPAWQMTAATLDVLRELSFSYATTRNTIIQPRDGTRWHAPALSFSARSVLRRWSSLCWANLWVLSARSAPYVRLALHPADTTHPMLVRAWRKTLERLMVGRTVITKAHWVRQQKASSDLSVLSLA